MTSPLSGRNTASAAERRGAALRRLFLFEPGEGAAAAWAATGFFFLLAGYYMLRPLRESAGIAGDRDVLHLLFTCTFATMVVAVPAFSALVARVSRARFLRGAYHFFAANLVLFAIAQHLVPESAELIVGRVFFVWLSVFNLWVVSIFWSRMAECFRRRQGERLFGPIAAGGSLGGIAGATVTSTIAPHSSPEVILLLAVLPLELASLCALRVARAERGESSLESAKAAGGGGDAKLGGSIWAGFSATVRSRYLLQIAAYLMCTTFLGTVVYFTQADLVRAATDVWGERTKIFGRIDTAVLVGTLLIQLLGTGRLLRAVGIGATLAVLPIIYLLGFSGFAGAPLLSVIVAFQILRRIAGYALAKPSKEVLFTVVPTEQKYKAKGFIDTVVYRGGDALGANAFHAASATLGLATAATALVTLPLCILWTILGVALGRRAARESAERSSRLLGP